MEMFMMIFVAAVLVESIWEAIKQPLGKGLLWLEDVTMFEVGKVGAAAVGVVFCVAAQIDLFEALAINITVPYVGPVFTGLIVARGGNVVHDLLDRIQGFEYIDYEEPVVYDEEEINFRRAE